MITQTHRLDVVPGGVTAVVHVKQYQTGESLVFELFSRFGDFEISAAFTECTVRGTKSDGNGYSANATCDPSNNSVTVELTEQMTAVAGRQPYEITVTDSTGQMITATFFLDVQRAALDADTVESESVIREVGTAVESYMAEHGLDYVNYPTAPDSKYGTAGQTLRTKGDGRTEWADVGLPTDAQTERAITAWLNAHPEATTTVQDGSISTVKLADGAVTDEKIDPDYTSRQLQAATLYDKPTMYRFLKFNRLTDSDGYQYGQQGATVTDKYIVLGMNSLGTVANQRNYIYVLDRDTYQPVTLQGGNPILLEFDSSTTPTGSHANSIAWDEDAGELYVFTMVDNIAIVFDDTTLAEKRRETMPVYGQIGYDNVNKQWCFVNYADSAQTEYQISIYNRTRTTLLKTVSGHKMGTTQGVQFHDGLIFLPTSVDSNAGTPFAGMQNIKVIDTDSNMVRSWWFNSGFELEDIGMFDESKLMVAANAGSTVRLFEMTIRDISEMSELTEFDALEACSRIEIGVVKPIHLDNTDNQWSYWIDPATRFVCAWGRFNVTPTNWTANKSDNDALYYSETMYVQLPFAMNGYKFSALAGGRSIVMNPNHGSTQLGFRLFKGSQATATIDVNIVLTGQYAGLIE